MAVLNYAMGQLNPVLYFIDSSGEIALPPTTDEALRLKDRMRQRGFELREASTLSEIDQLQRTMEEREFAIARQQLASNERAVADKRREIRDRLTSRMVSSSTTPYERDFIAAYLQLREDKRAQHRNAFAANQAAYFVQREFDNPKARLQSVADAIPNERDVACKQCGRFRRLDNFSQCFRCLYGVSDSDVGTLSNMR